MERKYEPLYRYSGAEAKRLGCLPQWRESRDLDIACKDAIEMAIRRGFDGMYLDGNCARNVLDEYGFQRVGWVLANTVQYKRDDGRFSPQNRRWANTTFIPPDAGATGNRNAEFVVDSHPAVLDGFIDQFRKELDTLHLFDGSHCVQNSRLEDFTGKVLVLSAEVLKESCLDAKNQLWLAQSGFGCRPSASGRAVFAICLYDSESARWDRSDFLGVLKDECLPDWGKHTLSAMLRPNQNTPKQGGMEMG